MASRSELERMALRVAEGDHSCLEPLARLLLSSGAFPSKPEEIGFKIRDKNTGLFWSGIRRGWTPLGHSYKYKKAALRYARGSQDEYIWSSVVERERDLEVVEVLPIILSREDVPRKQ